MSIQPHKLPNTESLYNLIPFNEALGGYSFGLHIAAIAIFLLVLVATVKAIVVLRGQGHSLMVACTRDIFLAGGCAFLVITFPGAFYFMFSAFWRAFTGHAQTPEDAA